MSVTYVTLNRHSSAGGEVYNKCGVLSLLQNAYRLTSIAGIEIRIHYTWLIIFGLVTWSLTGGFFAVRFPDWGPGRMIVAAVITSLLFFSSVLIHELGHSLVAKSRRVPVRRITLFIFGGAAQIEREADRPGDELAIAAAGPATSLGLALLFGGIALAFPMEPMRAIAFLLARINVTLAVFNLLPGFPLDGGRLFRAFLWRMTGDFRRSTYIASQAGQGIAYLLILAGILFTFTGGLLNGLWLVFIGWFLNNAAEASYRSAVVSESLRGIPVRQLMSSEYIAVEPSIPVSDLVHEVLLPRTARSAVVLQDGRLAGIVTLTDIKKVARDRWERVTVGEIMTPVPRVVTVEPESEVLQLLRRLDEGDLHVLPVIRDGDDGPVVAGIVSRSHLIRFLRLREDLGF